MIYSFRGKTYELDQTDIDWIDNVVEWKNDELSERIADTAEIMFEKGVDEIEEKTREQYEGKLYGAALDSVVAKAKKDYRAEIEADLEAGIPEALEDYREEVLEMNFSDHLIGTNQIDKLDLPDEAKQIMKEIFGDVIDVSGSIGEHQSVKESLDAYFEQVDAIINNSSSQPHGRRLIGITIPAIKE